MPKVSVGESFTLAVTSGSKKVWIGGGEYQNFPSIFFLSHSAEKFRRGTLHCCINFGYRKSLEKTGRGVSRFSVENFLSHSAKNFRRGILYCCINFGYRKSLDGRGEYQDFPSKIFCLTVPKISLGILYCCINFRYRKSLDKRGSIKSFRRKFFVSQCGNFP